MRERQNSIHWALILSSLSMSLITQDLKSQRMYLNKQDHIKLKQRVFLKLQEHIRRKFREKYGREFAEATMGIYMRALRAIYNYAQTRFNLPRERYPFGNNSVCGYIQLLRIHMPKLKCRSMFIAIIFLRFFPDEWTLNLWNGDFTTLDKP